MDNYFSGKPNVYKYWDEDNKTSIPIMNVEDSPCKYVNLYSTTGLSLERSGLFMGDLPLGVEIVGACSSDYEFFPNVLATCVFNVINSRKQCQSGAIFEDMVQMYELNINMKHILFVSPFLWDNKLITMKLSDRVVAWLLAIPISEHEYAYAKEKGTLALEKKLEKSNIDIFDLNRMSII